MIEVGSYVIIQKFGGAHSRLCRVRKGENILIEKLRFNIDGAFGKPYGLFEACAGKLSPATPPENHSPSSVALVKREAISFLDEIIDVNPAEELQVTTPDGDKIDAKIDGSTFEEAVEAKESDDSDLGSVRTEEDFGNGSPMKRQKLTQDQITSMKRAGVPANELDFSMMPIFQISKLVYGNQAFESRTEFSQLKYCEKKTRKHSDRVLILKPTIRLLIDSYFKRDPERICYLRIDLLGHFLQLSGIRVGSRVFVYEQTLGIVGASIIERLAGEGACIFLHRYQVPQSIPSIYAMEFDEKQMSTFYPLRLATFLDEFKPIPSKVGESGSEGKVPPVSNGTTPVQNGVAKLETIAEKCENSADRPTDDKMEEDELLLDEAEVERRRTMRIERDQAAINMMQPADSTSDAGALDVIALAVSTTDALELLERTYASLRLSGTIVIFSSVRQQVISVYNWLRRNGAVDLQVTDHFFRFHQVLPDRTHPLMRQVISGGYLLSAVKVRQ